MKGIKGIIPVVIVLIVFVVSAQVKKVASEPKIQQVVPSTFRMNQNIHNLPKDDGAQDDLIQKYVDGGYGGFAVNVSYNDYLTPSGMKTFKAFCDKAKKADLELWLYDEQGYPSGNAGGRVMDKNPAWEAMGIFKQDTIIAGGNIDYGVPPGKVIKAISIQHKDTVNLISHIKNGRLKYDFPSGASKLIVFSKAPLYDSFQASRNPGVPKGILTSHYPSLMIPEVTESFLEITHEAYVDLLGEDLGQYFIATFTDEPSLMAVSFPLQQWSVIPWAEVLSDAIETRYGYRPEDRLVELFEDAGSTGQQLRYQYFHTVGELVSTNYFKRIKTWCNEHNLKSGGHLLLEESMMAHVPLYGDIMACFREMDAPGLDALSNLPENTAVHAAKLASSAAELSGATRVMSEPCPVVDRRELGKEPTTEEVRGFINIQFTGGVTDFNNYLNLSNANTTEKKSFNEYVGRIAQELRGGHGAAEVALFYPIESLWTAFVPEPTHIVRWDTIGGGNRNAIKIEQAFRNSARHLFKNRWDYHIIDTKAIQDARVINGRLVHGALSWKMVILPQVNTLPIDVWGKLYEFVQAGGFLVTMGGPPVNSTTDFPDTRMQEISSKVMANENVFSFPDGNYTGWDKTIGKAIKKDILLSDEAIPIRYTRRVIDGKSVYFIINDSAVKQQTGLYLKQQSDYLFLDPLDGKTRTFKNGQQIQLEPYAGIILNEK
ncbi:hypothetical protein MWU78_21475 [Arenibacter sp. F26102]|uniref:hypothetical protein n=1 Tax=Arenibacter sp. F26102 TaxID=2926416 RepID=UPI001FF18D2F|nr:hypothetical protein [Arenibacter sp. F26102]MCK0148232.1 hypothetical protein [Arenibacter sp. F26102]